MNAKENWIISCKRFFLWLAAFLALLYFWQDRALFYDVLSDVRFGFLRVHGILHTIVNPSDEWLIWLPTVLSILIPVVGMAIAPKPPLFLRYIIVLMMALFHTIYIFFRTVYTLRFTDLGSGIATISLWFAEVMIYLCSLSLYIQLMFTVDRKKQTDIYEKDVLSGAYQPAVDVFITTHSEPFDIIRRTAVACQAINYKNKRVYILDDGSREDIKALSEELNCLYINRQDHSHAKAGNVNHALTKTHGDLIALFDADCVPMTNFLSRTVGFFQQDNTALVSSAQAFYNADVFKHNIMSLLEQSNFFRHTQSGRDRFNALLCFGTCYIVRREAIENIGGIPLETLSEDWATSIKLQAHGYQTYMLNEILGAGAVAESMSEFVQQRVRWTQGTLQSLFSSTNPLRIKGLSFFQRAIHSYGIMHYLINPFHIFVVVLPLLYFFWGFTPIHPSRGGFWIFFFPFFCFNALCLSWICQEMTSKLSALISESFMCIPLSAAVIKTLIKPFGWRFRVTRKGINRSKIKMNWILGFPLLFFLILSVIGVIYGYHTRYWRQSEGLFFFLFILTAIRIVFLWAGLYASHDLPQQRDSVRFNYNLKCQFDGKTLIEGQTLDISETGILMRGLDPVDVAVLPQKGVLTIEDIGFKNVRARMIRTGNNASMAFVFEDIPLPQLRRLIEYLYCRPEIWKKASNLDKKVSRAFQKALSWEHILKNNARAANRTR